MVVLFFKCTVESGICKFLLNLDFDHSMDWKGYKVLNTHKTTGGIPTFRTTLVKSKFEESSVKLQCLSGEGFGLNYRKFRKPEGSRNRDSAVNHTAHFITQLTSSSVRMGVRAPSDLAVAGRGGEKKYTMPEKNTQCPNSWVCNRDTKALIFCKKEKRLQFSRLVKPF